MNRKKSIVLCGIFFSFLLFGNELQVVFPQQASDPEIHAANEIAYHLSAVYNKKIEDDQ